MEGNKGPFLDRSAGGRRQQEERIVQAVRSLFDEHGLRDPSIGDIAKAVGINKATIYRHVATKEELFLLVLASYQRELERSIAEVDEALDPAVRLDGVLRRYLDFCGRYPAYLDCFLWLTASSYTELAERVSGAVLLHVGGAIAAVNHQFAQIVIAGKEQGTFDVEDPNQAVHIAYSAIIGVMQMRRLGVGIQQGLTGFPEMVPLGDDATIESLLNGIHRILGAPPP